MFQPFKDPSTLQMMIYIKHNDLDIFVRKMFYVAYLTIFHPHINFQGTPCHLVWFLML